MASDAVLIVAAFTFVGLLLQIVGLIWVAVRVAESWHRLWGDVSLSIATDRMAYRLGLREVGAEHAVFAAPAKARVRLSVRLRGYLRACCSSILWRRARRAEAERRKTLREAEAMTRAIEFEEARRQALTQLGFPAVLVIAGAVLQAIGALQSIVLAAFSGN